VVKIVKALNVEVVLVNLIYVKAGVSCYDVSLGFLALAWF